MAYEFTPARAIALAKAREKSAYARRGKKRRIYGHDPVKRGQGISGLRKNTVPYARVNKRSQTVGFNAGTILPTTGKRIVFGGYVRLENRTRKGAIDRAIAKASRTVAPKGTKRGSTRAFIAKNVDIKSPAIRANVGKAQVRLGTSRGAGPTVIIRRGRHATPQSKSRAGVRKYDRRIKTITGQKHSRKQRRSVG